MKQKIKKLKPSKLWFVDNLSGVTFGNAVSACLENYVYGLSAQESLDARISSTLLGLAFANTAYAYTRDKSREVFGVDLKKSSSKKINVHDSLYCGAFTFGFCLGMYELVTDQDFVDNCVNSLTTAGVYTVLGSAVSYNIDSFRDFFGVSENPKLPNRVKSLSNKGKKKLATGVLAAYTTIFASNYVSSEDFIKRDYNESQILEPINNVIEYKPQTLENIIQKSSNLALDNQNIDTKKAYM